MNISSFFFFFFSLTSLHCPCCIFSVLVLPFKYSCKWMEEVRGEAGKRREKGRRAGRSSMRWWGLPPFWSSLRRDSGRTGIGGRRGISRRPHDLFRPGGTCASQPLMAVITLPTHRCLEKKTNLWQTGKLIHDYCCEKFHLSC